MPNPVVLSRTGSSRVRAGVVALALALLSALIAPPASAATYVQVVAGKIQLPAPGGATPEDDLYHVDGCTVDAKDGTFSAQIGLTAYAGKTLEIRLGSADAAFGPPGLHVWLADDCSPLHQGGDLAIWPVSPRYKFKVTDENHLYLFFNGTAAGVTYSVWRCTSTTC